MSPFIKYYFQKLIWNAARLWLWVPPLIILFIEFAFSYALATSREEVDALAAWANVVMTAGAGGIAYLVYKGQKNYTIDAAKAEMDLKAACLGAEVHTDVLFCRLFLNRLQERMPENYNDLVVAQGKNDLMYFVIYWKNILYTNP